MSKHKPTAALLFLLTTAALASACDPRSVFDSVGRPNQLCTDLGDGHCPKPDPGDVTR